MVFFVQETNDETGRDETWWEPGGQGKSTAASRGHVQVHAAMQPILPMLFVQSQLKGGGRRVMMMEDGSWATTDDDRAVFFVVSGVSVVVCLSRLQEGSDRSESGRTR